MRRALRRGFTLIELLVGLAIGCILILLALPNYISWVADMNVQGGANSIAEGLRFAQASAIKRNSPVEFTMASGTGWTVRPPGGAVLKVAAFTEGAKLATLTANPATSTTVTFNFMGQIEPVNAAAPVDPFDRVDVTAPGADRPLRVLIGGGTNGIRVCDPNTGLPAGDPKKCP